MRKSQAFKIVEFMFQNALEGTGHSWTRMNGALHMTLSAAIEGGLRFGKEDFVLFNTKLRGGYWLGANPEGYYSAAVSVRNMSAVHAFEYWKERPPYILDGERITVGHRFYYGENFVECTSIHSEHLIVVERVGLKRGKFSNKIRRRFRITQDDLKRLRAHLKQRKKEYETARAVVQAIRAQDGN